MQRWRRVAGGAFLLVAVALLVLSVATRWDDVRAALTRLDPWAVVLSLLLAMAGLWAQMLSWRALFGAEGETPSRRVGAHVYFVGQLGKYVPGGAWSVLAQAELAHRYSISRMKSAIVALASMAVMTVTGAVVAAAGLVVGSPSALGRYWWVLATIPIGVAALVPPVFNRIIALLQRLVRRSDVTVRIDGPTLARSAWWWLVMWALFGLHADVLVRDINPSTPIQALSLTTGAFALAWVVGFLVVVAPAGTGPREAALVLALAPVVPAADALLVALVSRVLMVVADAAWAGVSVAVARSATRKTAPRRAENLDGDHGPTY